MVFFVVLINKVQPAELASPGSRAASPSSCGSELESRPSEDENGNQNRHVEENSNAALVVQVLEPSIPKEDIESGG